MLPSKHIPSPGFSHKANNWVTVTYVSLVLN